MIDQPWRNEAACIGEDIDTFFSLSDPGNWRNTGAEEAKRICRKCPVQQECLDYIMSFSEGYNYGIWGGTDEQERRRLRKRRTA